MKWTNDAGFGWTLELTPDASKLAVSKQCSYYQQGYTTAALKVDANDKVTGIMGPGNELYVAVPASSATPLSVSTSTTARGSTHGSPSKRGRSEW